MDKFLELIGLGKIQYKFSDFEAKLQNQYLKGFGIDFALIAFCIYFVITTKQTTAALGMVFISIFAVFFHSYSLLLLLCGKVLYITGTVMKDEKKSYTMQMPVLKNVTVLGKSTIIVKSDSGNLYNVPVGHIKKYENGDIVKVYFNEGSVYNGETVHTFRIINPILVLLDKSVNE